jgi:hypothetical protein
MPSKVLNLHFRILEQPLFKHPNGTKEMLERLRRLFLHEGVQIEVRLKSEKNVTHLSHLKTINIKNACKIDDPSPDQIELLSHRDGVISDKDVFIWFIEATTPTSYGCAAHSPGRPGTVITSTAPGWTLAHEICHILGLWHVEDNKRHLMFPKTDQIVTDPVTNLPLLLAEDITKLESNISVLI